MSSESDNNLVGGEGALPQFPHAHIYPAFILDLEV